MRSLSLPTGSALRGWGTVINIIGGAYIGGLIVCFGSLYFLYHDANERQPIPFELSFADQKTAVMAINKDDALKSPRYAVKHYRRLLIELAKKENPKLEFDESDPKNQYRAPFLDSHTLVHKKSNTFANFYIDIVSRYAKALLAKGQLEISVETLQKLVNDDEIFFRLGDAERLSQCGRLLARISPTVDEKESLLKRCITMIGSTFSSIHVDENYLLQNSSRITDELISCLNDMAFAYAKESTHSSLSRHQKQDYLSKALNIYLSNLKTVQQVQHSVVSGQKNQTNYPLFNCNEENLQMLVNEIRSHVSEIMWSKGYKQNAISWSEEVVDDIYYINSSSKRANHILIDVLANLTTMYHQIRNRTSEERCIQLQKGLSHYDSNESSWYDNLVGRFCRIIYNKGPLGVIEKALVERFGPPRRLLEIEEFEDEDTE
ncbi:hypothetical protein PSN45_002676 [Yamadazyma tenuis]|uniref:Uncharacterized protein n=1 Tax=Candida tenuis (strain ATCC 10573 / BCRC 21748 / CBS 615 / JCM 9827 / NBRC 10315 / NRRL Y-1498 / VKM Y-70) TaxID=590646 RepID=G3AX71_CANTC|nr:uncharacterized protein CANTEDRAFT_96694 [Yamadazyma tenuis ATCC 10573]EGV66704.1 hypothetical protein CANTEDRAFT_96694 [Yamadazyma tenuis ATCC 10573]WEJ95163.1 hypothetical protein PSN45_002676 [Yamadazyma tenuis]